MLLSYKTTSHVNAKHNWWVQKNYGQHKIELKLIKTALKMQEMQFQVVPYTLIRLPYYEHTYFAFPSLNFLKVCPVQDKGYTFPILFFQKIQSNDFLRVKSISSPVQILIYFHRRKLKKLHEKRGKIQKRLFRR